MCRCGEGPPASARAAAAAACMSDRRGVTEALTAGVAALLPDGVSRNASSMRCCRVPDRLLLRLRAGAAREEAKGRVLIRQEGMNGRASDILSHPGI